MLQEPSILDVNILDNRSLGWFQAQFILNITTDIPINVRYILSGTGVNAQKVKTVNSSIFEISPSNHNFTVIISPSWSTFPGTIHYEFTLFYINATTLLPQVILEIGDGVAHILIGIPLSVILGGIFIVGVIIIAVRPVRLRHQKEKWSSGFISNVSTPSESDSEDNNNLQYEPNAELKIGQIQCPECKQYIAEGSAFCPECGYHIPRFLRTNE